MRKKKWQSTQLEMTSNNGLIIYEPLLHSIQMRINYLRVWGLYKYCTVVQSMKKQYTEQRGDIKRWNKKKLPSRITLVTADDGSTTP